MATHYLPLGDRVIVEPEEAEQKTKSGIVLPDTAQEKPQSGIVISVGPGRVTDDGKAIPVNLEKGDRVLFAKYGGTEIKVEGKEYMILKENDILAKQSK